jgi:hypothetical protein
MRGDMAAQLDAHGFARISGPLRTAHETNEVARSLVDASWLEHDPLPLSVIGDFVVPPLGGGATRDFQTLHFDFGLPLDPKVEQEIARYSALYIPVDTADVRAVTRLVPLTALLSQRSWPAPGEIIERLTAYGRTHGAWDDERGYVEGSLARIVEAAAADRLPLLPSVKVEPGFLCGLEFDSLGAELRFFEGHGVRVGDLEISVALEPGELLVFDNLAMAHGRRGIRKPGELRQRIFGHRLQPAAQKRLRDGILSAFFSRHPIVADPSKASTS